MTVTENATVGTTDSFSKKLRVLEKSWTLDLSAFKHNQLKNDLF